MEKFDGFQSERGDSLQRPEPLPSFEERKLPVQNPLPRRLRSAQGLLRRPEPSRVHYEDSGQRTGEQPDLIHADSSLANGIRVPGSLAREILAYLKSLGKTVGKAHWDHFMKVMVEEYPDLNLLEHTYTFAFLNPNLLVRAARMLDRKIKPRAAKPFSKYNTAQKLHLLLTS